MELPIAPSSYAASADTLVRALKRADATLARTAAEETQLESATAFVNTARPRVYMLNHAADVRLPDGSTDADAALAEIFDHFKRAGGTCYSLRSATAGWPAPLADAAGRAGYVPRNNLLYRLERYRRPAKRNEALQVIPARAAYPEVHRLHERGAASEWGADAALARDLADTHIDFLDEARLDAFLGRLDRQPAGIVTVLTLGNIGVICDVHTDAEHRRKRVASTLLDHAIEHCQRALFESVILEAAEGNPAALLYESLGFTLVTKFQSYALSGREA